MDIELFVNGVSQGIVTSLSIISGKELQKKMKTVTSNLATGSAGVVPDQITFETQTSLPPFGRFSLKLPNDIIVDLRIEEIRGSRVQATVTAKRSGKP